MGEITQAPCTWRGLEELRPSLRSFLRRHCRDDNEIDDVVQETLLRAARYRPSLSDPGRLGAWAARIAGNVVRDRRRREARLARAEAEEGWVDGLQCREEPPGPPARAETLRLGAWSVDREDALAALGAALAELKPADRRVLASYYGGGGSCRATAAECRIAPGLVKVRLFRARRRLLLVLQRRLGALERAAPEPRVKEPVRAAR